ncbi:hypothetical protein [Jannaschia aquimarina]|uniref:Uncharacterized protein n=1 Tax=Jannaschia aquimarina TaxID=935700 RepID=A0A0D1EFF5_9RHOB|nr:hypothetical protein [Jannaschia aquimarina]KIT16349.1 hypothetical protein jaqu_19450 [Jannaschia aquimarina]SNT25792.1 hypothetical protein SAMN05421775_10940 [Jannaschia aquimarina]
MAEDEDLTGRWIGRYTYAAGGDPVPFEAELWQTGTTLEGRVTEPNTFRRDAGPELSAMVLGWSSGGDLGFLKRYPGLPDEEQPVYEGRLLMGGKRAEGVWHLTGRPDWTGRFSMSRKPRAAAKADRRTAREVERG